ncbi:MAG TPA: hypothetical protein VK421_03040 [Pyrinomonadaceae bacterium]|nr:hypothetical protein [Pyrinomonadaceae bacterium]
MHPPNKPFSPKRLASLSLLIIPTPAAPPLTGGGARLAPDLRPGQSSPAGKISAGRGVRSAGHAAEHVL